MPGASLNLVVIASTDLKRSIDFYNAIGIEFTHEKHGNGPEHVSAEINGLVFEIYPQEAVKGLNGPARLGFRVASVDETVVKLGKLGAEIISGPTNSQWGQRAVLNDPDGHRIEISEAPPA
jgi:catechol 2,3-dioxygenase-like lactoylglutathione lyase family enzyme